MIFRATLLFTLVIDTDYRRPVRFPLQNCIKPAIVSFQRKLESSIIKYFIDSGASPE